MPIKVFVRDYVDHPIKAPKIKSYTIDLDIFGIEPEEATNRVVEWCHDNGFIYVNWRYLSVNEIR
jgi:hypothetical protein